MKKPIFWKCYFKGKERYGHIQKIYTYNMAIGTTKKTEKRQDEIMNDKAEPLKRNNLIIEERTQINPHKPRYSETMKYSL
jgi:hypothetical protein